MRRAMFFPADKPIMVNSFPCLLTQLRALAPMEPVDPRRRMRAAIAVLYRRTNRLMIQQKIDTAGAVKNTLPNRSSTPPWPGIKSDASLTWK
jgi:hypothetical protein